MKSDEALKQIKYLKELTEKTRMNAAYGYPFFILWGILSMIGYSHRILLPLPLWGWIWSIISIIGIIISSILIIKRRKEHGYTPLLKKIGLQCLVLLAADGLIFGLLIYYKIYVLLNPYWAFQMGIVHLIAGVHMGRSITYMGLWMISTAIASYFMTFPMQHIWLAITFGGGVLFTGILFKRQLNKLQKGIQL